jgi:hypothetical protein
VAPSIPTKGKLEVATDKLLQLWPGILRFFNRYPLLFLIYPLLLLWIFSYIFRLFHTYDFNHPFTKLLCFTALFVGIFYLTKERKRIRLSAGVYLVEFLTFSGVFLWVLWSAKPKYFSRLWTPPAVDIGSTTQQAAQMLFIRFQNPYQSQTLNVLAKDPGFGGFKYGPMMILGYLSSAFYPQSGFKMASLVYLVLSLACLAYLAWQRNAGLTKNLATGMFIFTLAVIPERVFYELFLMGANDVFPIFLLLLSLVFLKRRNYFWAGLIAGLSFSAKFSPALFLIVLFIRRDFSRRFFLGVAAGLLPNVVFLIWDYRAFVNNAFLFNAVKQPDSTSLHSITPPELHFVFTAIQIVALAVFVARNFFKRPEVMELIRSFVLLLLIIEATFREVHGNHLLWFIPFLALLIGVNRYAPAMMLGQKAEDSGQKSEDRDPRLEAAVGF